MKNRKELFHSAEINPTLLKQTIRNSANARYGNVPWAKNNITMQM
jgi:hypothetical protein